MKTQPTEIVLNSEGVAGGAVSRRHAVEDVLSKAREAGFEPTIGPIALTLLGVGAIVGAGIFVLTGVAAAQFAGPAIVLSFLLAAVGCAFSGLCYAEFGSMMPASGSAYSYTSATLGEFIGWVIGWNLLLEYTFAGAYVAVGWSGYFQGAAQMFGWTLPHALTTAPFGLVDGKLGLTGGLINLPAGAIVVLLTLIASRGLSVSTTINAFIVALKVGVLLVFVFLGAQHINPQNLTPFIPPNAGEFGHFGWSGVLRGAAVVFTAYLGFDGISTVAQEVKNPQRSMPIGILGSLIICSLLYVAVSFVLTGLAPYQTLDVGNPLSVALRGATGGLDWLAPVIDVAAVAGLASIILLTLIGQPRVVHAMARDGLLPSFLGRMHARFKTPFNATLVAGVVITLLGSLFPIDILAQLVSLGALSVFATVCIAVLVLRSTRPDLKRPFRVPAVAIVAPVGALLCLYLLTGLPTQSWTLYAVWASIGLLIYLGFGRRSAARVRAEAGDSKKM